MDRSINKTFKESRLIPRFYFFTLAKSIFFVLFHPKHLQYWLSAFSFFFKKPIITSFSNFRFWIIFVFRLNKHFTRDFEVSSNVKISLDALSFAKKTIISNADKRMVFRQKHCLSIAVMFRNESHILKEWLEHYAFHGADHVYMINDGSTDDFLSILQPYIDSGFVSLYDSCDFPRFYERQALIYDLFIVPELKNSKWLAILDMDEFLYCPQSVDLKKVLQKYEQFSQVIVNWEIFSSNNLIHQPFSVVEGFTKKMSDTISFCNLNRKNIPFKSIIKSKSLICFSQHFHSIFGKSVFSSDLNKEEYPTLYINHYYVQSKEYWEKKKMKFGSANNFTPFKNRGWEMFYEFDVGDIDDLRLYEQNKQIIEKLKSQY